MVKRLALILLAGCSSTTASEPQPVPSSDVLCEVWTGNAVTAGTSGFEGIPGFGTLSTDVVAAWGEPSERKGDVWTYNWTANGRDVTVTLTFEKRDLCIGSKPVSGSWLKDIDVEGITFQQCWDFGHRMGAETCEGCLEHGEARECR
jgi:hypothetical protein